MAYITVQAIRRQHNMHDTSTELHLFTGQLRAEAGEADGERLVGRQGMPEVHRERVVLDLAELEDHRLLVSDAPWVAGAGRGDELEVLHGGDGHPSVEVQAPALQVVVPSRRFVP